MSLFITLEGPDGCGKTTQTALLATYLLEQGHDVVTAREPGGTAIGDQIRRVLMTLDNQAMDPRTEFLLFSASRAQLVAEIIRPHLDAGRTVLSDRFYDSSLAYQGFGHGLDLEALARITEFATGGLVPDLTLLLDIPVRDGLARRKDGGDWNRLDDYNRAFHQRARDGYLQLAANDPERWIVIDAGRAEAAVAADVRHAVAARLAARA